MWVFFLAWGKLESSLFFWIYLLLDCLYLQTNTAVTSTKLWSYLAQIRRWDLARSKHWTTTESQTSLLGLSWLQNGYIWHVTWTLPLKLCWKNWTSRFLDDWIPTQRNSDCERTELIPGQDIKKCIMSIPHFLFTS